LFVAAHTIGTERSAGAAGLLPKELRATICAAAVAVCTSSLGSQLRAVVLTGSLARDEPTFIRGERIATLVGDADFLVVLELNTRHPRRTELRKLEEAAEKRLSESGITAHVGLGAVSPNYFDRLAARSFTYELKNGGSLVWGDPGILERIPPYNAAALSKEDAWRTLNHRIIEVLMGIEVAKFSGEELTPDLEYAVIKLYLDMATSYLIFAGRYQPTYRARASELRTLLGEVGELNYMPFDGKKFSERVSECTERKLTGTDLGAKRSLEFLEEAVSYARDLWYWETYRLAEMNQTMPVNSIIAAMGRRQTFTEKLRGWASLLRRARWQAARRNWLRWATLCWVATPRYLTYGAAIQLFCELPRLVRNPKSSKAATDLSQVRALLPVLPPGRAHCAEWRSLAADVVYCYRSFLLDTVA
jgi:predicted nucleotidyltransferase